MIDINHVYKSYDSGASYAVNGVSLEVARGEFLGLIGESGCGKTTTLKMINRLVEPSDGSIAIDGEDIKQVDPVALRRNIGYVFQGIGLFPHYTVEQNVAAVPTLLKWDRETIDSICREKLELVGLDPDEFAQRYPRELSGGQQQRVGVARALAGSPDIVLMDEPFGALDPITRTELQDEFKRIQSKLNLTVIMVTHDMTEALLMADRIAVMKGGELLQLDTPHELVSRPAHDNVREMVEMPKNRAARLEAIMKEGG